MDRLIIPVNVPNTHWFVICVFFQERKIQAYDTSPVKDGRLHYIKAVFNYIQLEYEAYNGESLSDPEGWKLVPCYKDNNDNIVPVQDPRLSNCGVFSCLIMELLMNKIDPWILNDYRLNVDTDGRFALFHSIKFNKPVFQHYYTPDCLSVERCKNGPYNWEELFPLTAIAMNRDELPYIEELAYHLNGLKIADEPVGTALTPLPKPWDFKFRPPKLDDGVVWSYDPAQRIVLGNFTAVTDISWRHKQYIGSIMERDDLTLIMEGLASNLCAKLTDLKLLREELLLELGDQTYHNFRRFNRVEQEGFAYYRAEDSGVTPMKVKEYVRYLNTLMGESPTSPFSFQEEDGQEVRFDKATDVVFYMLDVDMTNHLLKIDEGFQSEFKLKEILPGGKWCMLNSVRCSVVAS